MFVPPHQKGGGPDEDPRDDPAVRPRDEGRDGGLLPDAAPSRLARAHPVRGTLREVAAV